MARRRMSLKAKLGEAKKADLVKMVQSLQKEMVSLVNRGVRAMPKSRKPIWPAYTRKTKARGRGAYARIAKRTKLGRLKAFRAK